MPTFFSFEQGSESRSRLPATDSSPLLGRFRAVPQTSAAHAAIPRSKTAPTTTTTTTNRRGSLGLLTRASWRNSVHVGHGYGALNNDDPWGEDQDDDDDDDDGLSSLPRRWCRRQWRWTRDLWVAPRQAAVHRVTTRWWTRWPVLVALPALLAVGWCAIPLPQYPLGGGGGGEGDDGDDEQQRLWRRQQRPPGHGEATVKVNFWFFLLVYYALYNLTALAWITKVFNLYSLNWWPRALGLPCTVALVAALGTAVPAAAYQFAGRAAAAAAVVDPLMTHNTVWIAWTFCIMAVPVAIACCILLTRERHLGPRRDLSETQRIFTSSWWAAAADDDDNSDYYHHHYGRAARPQQQHHYPDDDALHVAADNYPRHHRPRAPVRMRPRFFPASFVRFIWFCTALLIGLLAYVIGEAYAEVYLRTLPHSSLDTIVYVYGWILTVYLLDGLTGWILGGKQGERVGSYPLSWVFKLYFMLTYQTYVRALYARLRSPSQFILLQILSSSGLIILTPILLSAPFHWLLTVLGMNTQSYAAYQKVGVRNVFIRFLAENASMMCFLGSVVVLHFGPNKDVYPYFSFDEDPSKTGDPYDYTFELTFYASAVTWACELVASFVVAGLIRCIYGVNVVTEGSMDLAVWPELLPTSVVVMVHVLQNMLFSIARLQFR